MASNEAISTVERKERNDCRVVPMLSEQLAMTERILCEIFLIYNLNFAEAFTLNKQEQRLLRIFLT